MRENNIQGIIKKVEGNGSSLFSSVLEVLGINTRENS